MKSFKQYNEAYTDRFAHSSAEDDNKHLANIQDEKVLQRLNGFVGAIADKEYLQPEAAIKQLNNKLGIAGYNFPEPKISGDKGKTTVEVTGDEDLSTANVMYGGSGESVEIKGSDIRYLRDNYSFESSAGSDFTHRSTDRSRMVWMRSLKDWPESHSGAF